MIYSMNHITNRKSIDMDRYIVMFFMILMNTLPIVLLSIVFLLILNGECTKLIVTCLVSYGLHTFRIPEKARVILVNMFGSKTYAMCEVYRSEKTKQLTENHRSITCLSPHGPTVYPIACHSMPFSYDGKMKPSIFVSPVLKKIPFVESIFSILGNVSSVDPAQFQKDLIKGLSNKNQLSMYPGGFQDVFSMCEDPSVLTINVNRHSRLYKILLQEKISIMPLLILNEGDIFKHNVFLVKACKFVHHTFFRCGIPIPPLGDTNMPLVCREKIKMCYGDMIDVSSVEDENDYCRKHIEALQSIHKHCIDNNYTTKRLVIVDKADKKLKSQ